MQVRSWLFLKLESHRQRSLCISKHYLKTFSSIDSAFLFHEVWWDYWSCSPQISAVLMMVHYSTLRWRWTLDKNDSNWKPTAIFLFNQSQGSGRSGFRWIFKTNSYSFLKEAETLWPPFGAAVNTQIRSVLKN